MAQITSTPRNSAPFRIDENRIRQDLTLRKAGKIGLLLNPIFAYFFLWAPIVLLIVFSFNDSRSLGTWRGFTLQWYQNVFNDVVGAEARFSTALMISTLGNSLIVGIAATIIATILGTMVALSLSRGNYPGKRYVDGLLYLPVVIPEITQGISLLIFFNLIYDFIGTVTGTRGRAASQPSSSATSPSVCPTSPSSCAPAWQT